MIEIQGGDARAVGQGVRPGTLMDELPFARVFENRRPPFKTTRDDQVHGTFVVVICSDSPDFWRVALSYGFLGLIGESSVAIVAPQPFKIGQLDISARRRRQASRIQTWISGGLRHEQVQISVVVVVDES